MNKILPIIIAAAALAAASSASAQHYRDGYYGPSWHAYSQPMPPRYYGGPRYDYHRGENRALGALAAGVVIGAVAGSLAQRPQYEYAPPVYEHEDDGYYAPPPQPTRWVCAIRRDYTGVHSDCRPYDWRLANDRTICLGQGYYARTSDGQWLCARR